MQDRCYGCSGSSICICRRHALTNSLIKLASQYASTFVDRSLRPQSNTRTPSYGRYDAYLTRDFLSHIPPRPDYPRGTKIISGKEWHGSPTAMMWKSSAILQHRFGMPLDVIRLLSEWQMKCSEHEFPPQCTLAPAEPLVPASHTPTDDRPLPYYSGGGSRSPDPAYDPPTHDYISPSILQPVIPRPLHSPYPRFMSDRSQRSSEHSAEHPTSHTSYSLPVLLARPRVAWSPATTAQDKIEFYRERFAGVRRG